MKNKTKLSKEARKSLYTMIILGICGVVVVCLSIFFYSHGKTTDNSFWSVLALTTFVLGLLIFLLIFAIGDKAIRTIRYSKRESRVLNRWNAENCIKLNVYTKRLEDVLYISTKDKTLIYVFGNKYEDFKFEDITQLNYTERSILLWVKDTFEPYEIEYHTYGPDGVTLVADINLINSLSNLLTPYIYAHLYEDKKPKTEETVKCQFCGTKNKASNMLCTQCGAALD